MPEQLSFTLFHDPKVPGEFKYVENWNARPEWVMAVSSGFEDLEGEGLRGGMAKLIL
jgi:hypothetical protein